MVDEVPTGAPDFAFPLSGTSDSDLTASLNPALTRGAGENPLSVESLCPHRKIC